VGPGAFLIIIVDFKEAMASSFLYAPHPFTASYRGKVFTCHTREEEQKIWKGASHMVCVDRDFSPMAKKVGLLYLFLFHPGLHDMHIITDV
jgi:hypothetical protein